jgi:hypothetical protein
LSVNASDRGDSSTSPPAPSRPSRPTPGVSSLPALSLICNLCSCRCGVTSLSWSRHPSLHVTPRRRLFDRYTHAPSLSSFSPSLYF